MNIPTIPAGRYAKVLGLGGVVAVVLGLAWFFASCRPEPQDKIPPEVARRIDSMDVTRPAFDSTQAAGRSAVARDTVFATVFKVRADTSARVAARARITADSLAEIARVKDSSATAWKAAYEARTEEATEWRATAFRNDSAYRSERSARLGLAALYGADTLRRQATERINADLRRAIDRLEVPCRIVGPIPCPSRTVTMVLAGVGGAFAGAASKR